MYVWWKCTKGQQGDGINNVKADSTPQKVIGLEKIKQLKEGLITYLRLILMEKSGIGRIIVMVHKIY